MSEVTLFDEVGGEPILRSIVNRFVDRIFDDAMIGFFFQKADRARIKEKEYEFAARHLGGGVEYTGRPLAEAHAVHAIMGGQFMRRLQILKETLDEFGVPARVREHWIKNTEALRGQVTKDAGSACDPTLVKRLRVQ
jgi:hemoglobin